MAAPKRSAFEDLQSFFEEADGAFDQMDAERSHVIGCLRKVLEDSGHVEVVDVDALERSVDNVLREGDANSAGDAPMPDGAAERVQQLMLRDPEFARIALLMVMSPLSVDWNDPAVINVEKTLILEFQCHKKFRQRGPTEWRGQAWRQNSGRWGSRGGRSVRLAEFQAKFGKERGTEAFLEDEDRRRSLRQDSFVAKFGMERGTQAFQEDEAARASKSKAVARMMAAPPKAHQPRMVLPTVDPPTSKARPTPKMVAPVPIAR
ncbi:unnamed protein product, partial [Prorocentrum cordatum]